MQNSWDSLVSALDLSTSVIFLITSPLLVGLITPLLKQRKRVFYSLASLVPVVNLALLYRVGISSETIHLGSFFTFSLDQYAYLFGLLVSACWFLTLLYSSAYLRSHFQEKSERFHFYLASTVSLVMGAGLSFNFFTLLFFYSLAIPVIYPLITIRGDEKSRQAGRYYLLSNTLPMMGIVVPTVWYAFPLLKSFNEISIQGLGYSPLKAGVVFSLLVIGFAKNCVAPFHLWLPRSSVAPAPVTALVHSVAAVQTGVLAIIKVGSLVYGAEVLYDMNNHFFQTGWLTYLCGGTALYTAYRAWKTPDLKQRFSFSTVGQLSYILTAFLVGTEKTLLGALLHMVSHSFAKLNLFFCAGIFLTSFGSVEGPVVARYAPGVRWIAWIAAISGLSITGFPFLAGFYSKDLMLIEEFKHHHYAAALFLLAGSLINLVYILPIIRAGFAQKTEETPQAQPIPWPMIVAVVTCTAMIIGFSKYLFLIMKMVGVEAT